MNRSPAEIRDRWLNYGRRYARWPTLHDSSVACMFGPLAPEGGTLRDYSGRTAGAVWSVGAGDTPKYVQGSVRGGSFWSGQYDGSNDYAVAPIVSIPARGTLVQWLQHYTPGATAHAFAHRNGTTNSRLYVQSRTDGTIGLQFADQSTTVVASAGWRCTTIRWDGSTVDWIVDGSIASSVGYTYAGGSLGLCVIGAFNQQSPVSASLYFAGGISTTLMHSRSLTTSEISTVARHPLAAFEVEVPRYWTFPLTSTTKPWLYARTSSRIIGGGIA